MKNYIITSNIFLLFPVIAAFWAREWLYFSIAFGLIIFSTIYHYLSELNPSKTLLLKISKNLDWILASCGYIYMFYYVFTRVNPLFKIPLFIALALTLVFFYYGYKFGNYKKLHPWFHFITFTISGIIVISKF